MRRAAICFLFASVIASAAQAGDGFVGIGFGQSKVEFRDFGVNFDPDDTAYEIFGGYRFTRYIAIEAAYSDLGNLVSQVGAAGFDVEADVAGVKVMGILPATPRLDLYAKVGVVFWRFDGRSTDGMTINTIDENGTDPGYGIGLGYRFTESWGLRLEWEQFETDADQVRLGTIDLYYQW